ncbi:short chain dehydrogenase [Rhodoblastus acidophilus]|uniref:Short chain dehydrogenase n=1 Tax=Rhodoblastus acidophilus TaxID=1074 RepID=A0A212SA55_RHOAC|nr:short chain dehydrogenase [Rhodoblastus acidophilus]
MQIEFKGKTAIVMGSTSGIGFAIGLGLVRSDARVILNGRKEARLNEAVARMRALAPGAEISGPAADLATTKGVDACISAAGSADIVVNNLGAFKPKPFGEITDADWLRFFETNVLSGIRLSRHYLLAMI